MAHKRKVRVFRGPADSYAGSDERIMEFAAGSTAAQHINGLVAFKLIEGPERRLRIDVYSVTGPVEGVVAANVTVHGGPQHEPTRLLYAPEPKPEEAP